MLEMVYPELPSFYTTPFKKVPKQSSKTDEAALDIHTQPNTIRALTLITQYHPTILNPTTISALNPTPSLATPTHRINQ